jgi:hypothetical protein|tara:strand:+ start:207 stop:644 length:438 start_codon:yes stop_codon:yes gene_type:complete
MFKLTAGQGFSVVLPNDWEVSVQWGAGNYCDNRTGESNPFDKANPEYGKWQSRTAELRAIDVNGKPWEFPDGEEVLGYCTVEQALEFISAVAKVPDWKPTEAWERKWLGIDLENTRAYKVLKASGYIDLVEQPDLSSIDKNFGGV